MKKLCVYIILGLIFTIMGAGFGFAGSEEKPSAITDTGNKFLTDIEQGTADADVLVNVIKRKHDLVTQISHAAVANYMEALANEGMLKLIPTPYYSYDDVQTALYVVFQDRTNVVHNWDIFENVWLPDQICPNNGK